MSQTIAFIDPGTRQSALVRWDGARVLSHAIHPNPALRELLLAGLGFAEHIGIERIRHQGVAIGAEVLDTVEWIGRFVEIVVQERGSPPILVPRATIKTHICGRPNVKDSNVRAALIERFGEPGKKAAPGTLYGVRADEWQALAGAVFVYDTVLAPLESILK